MSNLESLINESIKSYKLYQENHSDRNRLFEQFIDKFNSLLSEINEIKQKSYAQFMNTFQTTNFFIITLYELIAKWLNQITIHSPNEQEVIFIRQCIEFLYLILSGNDVSGHDDDVDEFSLACCEQLTKDFNFTTPLCSLLYDYSRSSCNNKENIQLLGEEKYFRIAFNVLNKLTLNNKLYTIDYFASNFIHISTDKIIDKSSSTSSIDHLAYYLQFISNVIRKNSKEIELLLLAKNSYSQFCREISQLVNEAGDLVLNACIIYVKLCFEEKLPETISTRFNSHIDMSLKFLTDTGSRNMKKIYDFPKENAANFLSDFFTRKQVIEFLHMNEEYSILVLLKLNHLLLENKLTSSVKVFEILKTIIKNSQKLAARLFQIVFDTSELFEKLSKSNLANKIQEIISTVGNESISDWYIKATKISLNSKLLKNLNKTCQYGTMLLNNVYFHLNYLEYLIQLFKDSNEKKIKRAKIILLFESLQENLISLQKLYNTNFSSQSNHVFEKNREILDKILNYTVSLIQISLEFLSPEKTNTYEVVTNLFKMIKCDNEREKYFSPGWSIVSDNVNLSDENILISSRVLIRIIENNPENKQISNFKEPLYKIFQEDFFLSLISYAIKESDRTDLSAFAYEILFKIKKESNKFDFEAFLSVNENKKEEKALNEEKGLNNLGTNKKLNDPSDLIDFYQNQLNEKSVQVAKMLSTINQNFMNFSLIESEAKEIRDQLKKATQNLANALKENKVLESKINEITKPFQDLTENNLELDKENSKLVDETEKLKKQYASQKNEIEQTEKLNSESIKSLQETLKNEKTVRIQAERKVVVMESKITDLDNNKKILEKKLKELESKMQLGSKNLESRLDEKLEEINRTSSNLNNLEIEYEKLKIEHEKLKSIISYVRENYK